MGPVETAPLRSVRPPGGQHACPFLPLLLALVTVMWAGVAHGNNERIEGNWSVEWHDYPEQGQVTLGALTVKRPRNHTCQRVPEGGCLWREVRDDAGAWSVNGSWGPAFGQSYHNAQALTIPPTGEISIQHYVGVLGLWGAESRLVLVSTDRLEGTWRYGERSGREIWRRALPRVERIKIISEVESEGRSGGAPAQARMTYTANGWGPGNDMRGNRPRFRIDLYGDNLWGHHVIEVEDARDLEVRHRRSIRDPSAAGKPERAIGASREVILWPHVTPGRKVLRVDHLRIPFELVAPGFPSTPAAPPAPAATLRIIGPGGQPLAESNTPAGSEAALDGVRPFRVELVHTAAPSTPPRTVRVAWSGGSAELPLQATSGGKVWASGWHYLSSLAMRDRRELRGLDEANEPWTTRVAAELFAGSWQATSTGLDVGQSFGVAEVARDGKTVDLVLRTGDQERRFRSFEVLATRDPEGPQHTLSVRFDEVLEGPPRRLLEGREQWPDGQVVFLQDDTRRIRFEAGAAQLEAAVSHLPKPPNRIQILLMARSPGRLAGAWGVESPDGQLEEGGQMSWMRGGQLEGIVVLEDQRQRPARGAGPSGSLLYPFADDGRVVARTSRTLFVYGRDLPTSFNDAIALVSLEETLAYELVALPGEHGELFEQGWRKARVTDRQGRTALILQANLQPGVVPGVKGLRVNGLPGAWPLDFADSGGLLSFAHQRYEGEFTPTDSLYSSDVAFAVIDVPGAIPIDSVTLKLRRNGQPVGSGELVLRRVPGASKAEYRSPPLHLARGDLAGHAPPPDPSAIVIDVRPGDTLQAEVVDPFLLPTAPEEASAKILSSPGELGATWRDALRRMAVCHGEGHLDPTRLTHQEAESYTKFILTEFSTRDIRLTKGDHAAAILLRDEVVRVMTEALIPAHQSLLAGGDDGLLRFMEQGRTAGGAFWTESRGRDGRGREVPLAQLLDHPQLAAAWGMSPSAARLHAIREVRAGLRAFTESMSAAVRRARGAGDCNLMELMVIAGYRMEPIVARLMPRLVKLTEAGGRKHWAPDLVAQGYVQGLHTSGAAVRALDEYARIDDAYKAMALALVSGGAAFAASAAGYAATASYLLVGADAADMLYFGGKGVAQHFEGKALVEYARGLTPAVGDELLTDAKLASSQWYEAALGVIAPGLGVGMGLRHLRSADAVARGGRLADRLGDFDAATLARLTDAEREELAALFTELHRTRLAKGVDALSEADRSRLARFDRYFGPEQPLPAGSAPRSPGDVWPRIGPPSEPGGSPTAGSNWLRMPRSVGTRIATPDGLSPVFPQENWNACGVAALRTALKRLTGAAPTEQEVIRKSFLTGRGYRTNIDFNQGNLAGGGTTVEGMVDMLEDAGVPTRHPGAGGFSLDEATQALREGHQVLAFIDYARVGGVGVNPHWVVLEKVGHGRIRRGGKVVIDGPYVIIGDPAEGVSVAIARGDFLRHWRPDNTVVGLNRRLHPDIPAPVRPAGPPPAPTSPPAGAAIRPVDLPGHLHQFQRMLASRPLAESDLAGLIDDFDLALFAHWRRGADSVSQRLRERLHQRMSGFPEPVRRELRTHFLSRLKSRQTFFHVDASQVAPPELGFPPTTQTLRDLARSQGTFRDPATDELLKQTGPIDADHIYPVARIREIPGFSLLTLDEQMQVVHNPKNIQPLPSLLNRSKGDLLAHEWQAARIRAREPISASYVERLAAQQEECRALLQAQIHGFLKKRRVR